MAGDVAGVALPRVGQAPGQALFLRRRMEEAQKKAEEDAHLDEALAETFPASDPPSLTQPRTGADVP